MIASPTTSDSPVPAGVGKDSSLLFQNCPACEAQIETTNCEPLSTTACPECGTEFVVGEWIDHYQLLSVAGRGGMGVVFRALDTSLDRQVALKILRKDRLSAEAAAQLDTEAAITASINHPHVVKVFTTGTDHGRFYIAMELVDKGTLDDLIRIQGHVAEAQALDVAIQVAQGLRAASQLGMIHRDVKPGNILFADAHTAKVVDFGLAMLEQAAAEAAGAEIWGTPYYVAPEKLDQQPEDFRSDIYSLGASLFHALAGRPPFEAEDANMVALKHLKSQAVSLQAFAPRVSGSTAYIINRTLLKNPDERYQSYDELIEHLEYARNELIQNGGKAPEKKRLVLETEEDQKLWSYLTFAMIALCAIFIGGYYFYTRKPAPQKPKASAPVAAVRPQKNSQYDSARRALLDGKAADATRAFHSLGQDRGAAPPIRQWAIVHEGLCEYLGDHPAEAGAAFTALQRDDYAANDAAGRKLAAFFRSLAILAGDNQLVPASVTKDFDQTSYGAMACLVLGFKDWDLGQYEDAVNLFRAYESALPSGEDAWAADYKTLTEGRIADYSSYSEALSRLKGATTPEAFEQAKASMTRVKFALRSGSGLGRQIDETLAAATPPTRAKAAKPAKTEPVAAAAPSEPASKPAPAPAKSTAVAGKGSDRQIKAINELRPSLAAMCADWKFGEASSALSKAAASTDTARREKWLLVRKLDWLNDFKKTLIGDATAHGCSTTLKRTDDMQIKSAAKSFGETGVTFASGETVEWAQISPDSIIELAKQLMSSGKGPEQAARRSWIAGMYAVLNHRMIEGRILLGNGGKVRPDYEEAIPIVVPSKAQNFARGADASASSAKDDDGETADQAIDGAAATKWYTNQPGPQWLRLDLHQPTVINRWIVRHAQSGGESAELNTADFALQASADGNTWANVDAVSGNTSAVTNRELRPFSARYLRLVVTKPSRNAEPGTRICEFELYGPASSEAPEFVAALQEAVAPHFTGTNLGLGAGAASGSSEFEATTGLFTIHAEGTDIWKDSDAGRFLSREAVGNGKIVAYIRSIEPTDPFAKCGVMYRGSLAPNAATAYLCVTPSSGALFEVRTTSGGTASSTKETSITLPCWVKITRQGDTFTGSVSVDGASWKQIGNPETAPLGPKAHVGLAATSHIARKLGASKVSEVRITGE